MTTARPPVTVRLIGTDGNAFALIGRVNAALRKAGYPEEVERFTADATTCESYDDLLCLIMETVEVE